MSQTDQPWDEKTAQWYVENYGEHSSNYKIIELATLQADDAILDIGCGSGTAVREAAKTATQGTVTGIDPSPAMVKIAAQKTEAPNVQFLEGGAELIPANDDQFTVVIALNSLHHWRDVRQGLEEVKRVLGENGRFIIGEEQFEEGMHEWSLEKIIKTVIQAGFTHIRTTEHQLEDCKIDVLELTLQNQT